MSEQVSTFSPSQEKFQLGRIGGYLGMAGAIISMLIFTVGCFGYFQVFMFMPFIPLAFE